MAQALSYASLCVAFRKQEEKEIDCPFYVSEGENTVLYQPSHTHTLHTKTCSHTQNSPSSSRELQPKARRKYSKRIALYSFSFLQFVHCAVALIRTALEKQNERKSFFFSFWKSFESVSFLSLLHPFSLFSFNWFKEAISHIELVRWGVPLWADVFFIHAGCCKIAARSIIDSIGPRGPLTRDQ